MNPAALLLTLAAILTLANPLNVHGSQPRSPAGPQPAKATSKQKAKPQQAQVVKVETTSNEKEKAEQQNKAVTQIKSSEAVKSPEPSSSSESQEGQIQQLPAQKQGKRKDSKPHLKKVDKKEESSGQIEEQKESSELEQSEESSEESSEDEDAKPVASHKYQSTPEKTEYKRSVLAFVAFYACGVSLFFLAIKLYFKESSIRQLVGLMMESPPIAVLRGYLNRFKGYERSDLNEDQMEEIDPAGSVAIGYSGEQGRDLFWERNSAEGI